MPLNSPEDYDRLGEHLAEIDGSLAAFATNHGYTLRLPSWGGRYPNRRIDQEGVVNRSIIIEMDVAADGQRFEEFFPDIPYTISSAPWIDDFQTLTRWHGPFIAFRDLPFSVLVRTLEIHLVHCHGYLSTITEDYITACARTSALPRPPDLTQS